MRKTFKKFLCACLALSWVGNAWAATSAEEEMSEKEEETVKVGTLTGTVSSVGKNFINVEYTKSKGNAYERFLPLSDKVRLENFQSLNELRFGDKVRVQYQETYKEDKNGKKVVLKTVATDIALLKESQQQGLRSIEGQVPVTR